MSIIEEISAERQRQITVEGRTEENDDQNSNGELAQAAAVYAMPFDQLPGREYSSAFLWPNSWNISWFKPTDRRRDLIKAAALIVAEIERIDRAS